MRKGISIIISFIIFFISSFNVYANEVEINAKAGILMEANTGQILYENNIDEQLPIASVTKVMTMLLTFEALDEGTISLDDMVTISDEASGMGGSQVFLETGEEQSVETLIKSVVIASGNDASVALAEHVGGNVDNFVSMMNSKAEELNMLNTYFLDTCGLTDIGHYSSARDVAIMSQELITKYPDVFNYTNIWNDNIVHKTNRGEEKTELWNTNKMLKTYDGINGLKTGFTSKAGFCITATATRDNLTLISVILGGETSKERFSDAGKLLDLGFYNYKQVEGLKITEPQGVAKITKGTKKEVPVYQEKEVMILVNKNETKDITTEIEIVQNLVAPIPKGSKVGSVKYFIEGEIVANENLIIHETVAKAGIKDNLRLIIESWV